MDALTAPTAIDGAQLASDEGDEVALRKLADAIKSVNLFVENCPENLTFAAESISQLVSITGAVFSFLDAHTFDYTEEQLAPLVERFRSAMDLFVRKTNNYSSPEFSSRPTADFLETLVSLRCTNTRVIGAHTHDLAQMAKFVNPAFRILYYSLLFSDSTTGLEKQTYCFLMLHEIPALSRTDAISSALGPLWRAMPLEIMAFMPASNLATPPLAFIRRLVECDVYDREQLNATARRLCEATSLLNVHVALCQSKSQTTQVETSTRVYFHVLMSLMAALFCSDEDFIICRVFPKPVIDLVMPDAPNHTQFQYLLTNVVLPILEGPIEPDLNVYDMLYEISLFLVQLGNGWYISRKTFFRFFAHASFAQIRSTATLFALGDAANRLEIKSDVRSEIVAKFPLVTNPCMGLIAFSALHPPTTQAEAIALLQLCIKHSCFPNLSAIPDPSEPPPNVKIGDVVEGAANIRKMIDRIEKHAFETAVLYRSVYHSTIIDVLTEMAIRLPGGLQFELLITHIATQFKKDFPPEDTTVADALFSCLNHMKCPEFGDVLTKTRVLFKRGLSVHAYTPQQLINIYARMIYVLNLHDNQNPEIARISAALHHACVNPPEIRLTPTYHIDDVAKSATDPKDAGRIDSLVEKAVIAEQRAQIYKSEEEEARKREKQLKVENAKKDKSLKKAVTENEALKKRVLELEEELRKQEESLRAQLAREKERTEEEITRMQTVVKDLELRVAKRSPLPPECYERLSCVFSGALPKIPVVVDPLKAPGLGLTGVVALSDRELMVQYLQEKRKIEKAVIDRSLIPLPWLVPVLDSMRDTSPPPTVYLHNPLAALPVLIQLDEINHQVQLLFTKCEGIRIPGGTWQRFEDLQDALNPVEQARVKKLLRTKIPATLMGGAAAERVISDLRVIAEGAVKLVLISIGSRGNHPILSAPAGGNILRDSHRLITLLRTAAAELGRYGDFEEDLARLEREGWEFYRTEYVPRDQELPLVYQMMWNIASQLGADPSEDKKSALATAYSEEVMPSVTFLLETVLKLLRVTPK